MTTKTSPSRLENKWLWIAASGIFLSFFILLMFLLADQKLGMPVQLLCLFYLTAILFFFLAQIIGFIWSQTHYSDTVESPKFSMLDNEEAEWKH